MNFLVHAWLSYPNKDLTWGNLYADAYKGSSYEKLPESKSAGVSFHRHIDDFTDSHPLVLDIVHDVRICSGRMAPIFVDVAFDYWLHRYMERHNFPIQDLILFVHEVLKSSIPKSGKMTRMLPFLLQEEWLKQYGTKSGLESAFAGLNYRMNMNYDTKKAMEMLTNTEGVMARTAFKVLEDLQTEMVSLK